MLDHKALTSATAVLVLGVTTASSPGQIAGCANEIPIGFVAVDELRHDDGSSPDYLVTAGVNSGQQDEVVHANRYTSAGGALITHICIYTTNPDANLSGAQQMILFIAHGDDNGHNDTRPGSTVWSSLETIQVGWQLIEVNPPVVAQATTWIGAKFPTATATNPHMGVTVAGDYMPDGVTPVPNQSFVGILNTAGGQDIWTDYDDVPIQAFQGHRAIIRGLTVDLADCSAADIIVTIGNDHETSESGDTANFDVALTGPLPTDNVLVIVTSTDETEGIPNTIALIFNPANAGLAQTVTVTGQDDPFPDGDIPYAIELLGSSLDPCYHGIQGPSVALVNEDDDGAPPCPADVNGDLVVDILDFLAVLAAWGTGDPAADVDGDGIIGIGDFLAVLAAWGNCP